MTIWERKLTLVMIRFNKNMNDGDSVNDSTLYGYDISGNVKTLKQFIKALAVADTNGYKQVDYDYDLVSGKANPCNLPGGH